MSLYRVSIPKDDAWSVIQKLGKHHTAHFVDLNKNAAAKDLLKGYTLRIKACNETERRINFLLGKSKELGIDVVRPKDEGVFDIQMQALANTRKVSQQLLFESIEKDI